ncbi:MAG: hypothetical protein LC129_11845 [Burkholderiales bacterium]|nr:hypothetical protein [Burkholderiales bacterium]
MNRRPIACQAPVMPKPKPLIDEQGEVRELSAADLKRMHPATAALPASLQTKLRTRGPQKAPTKQRIIIRPSPESASGA